MGEPLKSRLGAERVTFGGKLGEAEYKRGRWRQDGLGPLRVTLASAASKNSFGSF